MHRFFVEKDRIKDNTAVIVGEDIKHIRRVLRLGIGDRVILFDKSGLEYYSTIRKVSLKALEVEIFKKKLPQRESPLEIILAQGLPRLPKMDIIVQKVTELGVSKILPFHSHRSIAKLSEEKSLKKVKRWQKIALEATKQCGRNSIPQICTPVDFAEITRINLRDGLKLILWEEESVFGLKQLLDAHPEKGAFLILVGPEGGFIHTEIKQARKEGFHVVSMGNRILRSETASISIISIIQHRFGDLK